MFQDLTLEEWAEQHRTKDLVMIDVRSPSEYAEATIPGSINIPIFEDDERAEIGILYKQVSVQAAKDRGLEIVSAKLPEFIKKFAAIPQRKAVFCWRGGMRSRTTATVLSLMGISAYRLAGGYRAYRQWVVQTLGEAPIEPEACVIHGNTGSGKTALLRKLQEKGYPVLDLEGLAGHRGSIFGQIGLKANNQKTFDSLLLEELMTHKESGYLLMEAESRRIGKVALPDSLMFKKESGYHIFLQMPLESRIRTILEDYRPEEHQEECIHAFHQIKSRIHTPVANEIEMCLSEARYGRAVELLLEYYYDPRYAHSTEQYELESAVNIEASSLEEAVERIEQLLAERYGTAAAG
ncbi:tRNA 2-selenouridine(34) synthase MnmH [Paenibacillus sp. JX-17]|uniref:tRNA 2-selenouridine(34) synthase MnmH n=1 Tax=Paenibacillus lacisoli TaxID=3064525 RepID=A0ABT9C8L9_9BACL|nr:tRNA 2-selenouridine(34) synthase MnmH [Paenibacillus sp. JX-17]MDO7905599.1 tRNA 2-selenouridine(34) synthase MnmH [Paenibacillus sp. JX-17]